MRISTLVVATTLMLTSLHAAAEPPICGDVNDNGALTASDSLAVLRAAVGQPVALICPAIGVTQSTGQTTCFDTAGTTISCEGTGQDAEIELGLPHAFADNGDGTVTDADSGLMWEKLSDDGTIHDKDNAYNWLDAFSVKIATLNTENFAGHDDWRLPNVRELQTIIDYGTSGPSTYAKFNTNCTASCTVLTCSCTASTNYWTSTTYKSIPSLAWVVLFSAGDTSAYVFKVDPARARAVRGGL